MEISSNRRFMTINETSEALGVTATSVYRWAWSGELKTVKIGGRRLVPLDAIESDLDRAGRGVNA